MKIFLGNGVQWLHLQVFSFYGPLANFGSAACISTIQQEVNNLYENM